MKEVALKTLEKSQKHNAVGDAVISTVDFITSLKDTVGGMLGAYPPASFAWAGICVTLPVSLTVLLVPYSA
jgi:hypothetical protein